MARRRLSLTRIGDDARKIKVEFRGKLLTNSAHLFNNRIRIHGHTPINLPVHSPNSESSTCSAIIGRAGGSVNYRGFGCHNHSPKKRRPVLAILSLASRELPCSNSVGIVDEVRAAVVSAADTSRDAISA